MGNNVEKRQGCPGIGHQVQAALESDRENRIEYMKTG